MKKIIFAAWLTVSASALYAQYAETIKVKAGNDIAQVVSQYGIYRFAAFEPAVVYFKDGKMSKQRMNYNILNDQVMYIDGKGDTLAVAVPDEIQKVSIAGVDFLYEKPGYLESVAAEQATALAVKRRIILHFEKEGAFGISNSTNGIDSYTTFVSNNSSYHLIINEDATLKKLTSYFLLTTDNKLLPATKSNFLTAFAANRKDIESYLSTNKVNFNNEQDLRQLLAVSTGRH